MDRNEVNLEGRIGTFLRYLQTQDKKEYVSLAVEVMDNGNSSTHSTIYVRCFKPTVVTYLKKVNAKQGNRVVVNGFISSFPMEVKGKQIFGNSVTANSILIIKVKDE